MPSFGSTFKNPIPTCPIDLQEFDKNLLNDLELSSLKYPTFLEIFETAFELPSLNSSICFEAFASGFVIFSLKKLVLKSFGIIILFF